MGLIMLILIGTVPTAYALNHAVTTNDIAAFVAASDQADQVVNKYVNTNGIMGADPRAEVTELHLAPSKCSPTRCSRCASW